MPTIIVTLALSLLAATPSSSDLKDALDVVSRCDDLKATSCLQAATVLEQGGERAFKLITPKFSQMSALGQMLALSVYGSHPGHEATMGLAKLVLKLGDRGPGLRKHRGRIRLLLLLGGVGLIR